MAGPYRKQITWASVYGTFTYPLAVTAVKLQHNHKRFKATYANFRSCHVSSRLKNLTTLIEIAVYNTRYGEQSHNRRSFHVHI